jgi:hypothetical protein
MTDAIRTRAAIAAAYAAMEDDPKLKARWFSLIAAAVPEDTRVGDALTEEDLLRLFHEAQAGGLEQ